MADEVVLILRGEGAASKEQPSAGNAATVPTPDIAQIVAGVNAAQRQQASGPTGTPAAPPSPQPQVAPAAPPSPQPQVAPAAPGSLSEEERSRRIAETSANAAAWAVRMNEERAARIAARAATPPAQPAAATTPPSAQPNAFNQGAANPFVTYGGYARSIVPPSPPPAQPSPAQQVKPQFFAGGSPGAGAPAYGAFPTLAQPAPAAPPLPQGTPTAAKIGIGGTARAFGQAALNLLPGGLGQAVGAAGRYFAPAMAVASAAPAAGAAAGGGAAFGNIGIPMAAAMASAATAALAVGGALAIAAYGLHKLNQSADEAATRLSQFNAPIATAKAQAEVADVQGEMRRGQQLAPQLVEFTQAQSKADQAWKDLVANLLQTLLPIATASQELLAGIYEVANFFFGREQNRGGRDDNVARIMQELGAAAFVEE